jgi:cold-inducible RNA-binding protein
MTNLYVGNLSFETTDDGLRQMFITKGFQVTSARVIRDRDNGRSRGFGFVELGQGEDSARAVAELDGHSVEGRQLQVKEARPQAPRDGGGSRDHWGHGSSNKGGRRY